jgi:hypothetical protein
VIRVRWPCDHDQKDSKSATQTSLNQTHPTHPRVAHRDLAAAAHEGPARGARSRHDVLRLTVKPGCSASGRCATAAGSAAAAPDGAPGALLSGAAAAADGSGGGGGIGGGSGLGGGSAGAASKEGWSVAFQEFVGAGALDSALALIHHLLESDGGGLG